VKALACELPATSGLPLSRVSTREIARAAVARGIVCETSGATVWRWLAEDGIKPWQYRSWIFLRDPAFRAKAARVLDLYEGRFEGKLLHPADFVLCADEKPSIQARRRKHETLPARGSRGQKVEHEYERMGALCYFATWDVKRARLFGRCEPAKRHRALRAPRLPGDGRGALPLRATRLLDRRQRFLAPRPALGRAARGQVAEAARAHPRPPADPTPAG
jgi:hypothetical protein